VPFTNVWTYLTKPDQVCCNSRLSFLATLGAIGQRIPVMGSHQHQIVQISTSVTGQ